jgi:hypothetical protein
MASTYTANSGIEKIGDAEQTGLWGDTTNLNFDIIDRVLNGVGAVTLSGTTHTLTTTDGTLSPGQFKVLVFGGTPSGTNTVTVAPNDQAKQYFVVNNSGQSVIISQGSGADVTVADGASSIVYLDGAGAGAAVVQLGSVTLATLGITATTAELNILDGVTATTAELNILDGVTATTLELNILDGVTATTLELNYNDIVTLGTSAASKAVTADANGDVILSEELKATSYNETYVAVTSTTNATTVNSEAGNTFMHTLTENTTFTFSNPPASGTAYTMSIEIIQDASASGFTVTWPTSVDWPAATAPTLTATANAVDVFVFATRDGGTTWRGFTAGQAMA